MRNFSAALPAAASQVHLTSAAVNGLPSCHLTPWRSGRSAAVPSSSHDQSLARSGTIEARLFCATCWSNSDEVVEHRPSAACRPRSSTPRGSTCSPGWQSRASARCRRALRERRLARERERQSSPPAAEYTPKPLHHRPLPSLGVRPRFDLLPRAAVIADDNRKKPRVLSLVAKPHFGAAARSLTRLSLRAGRKFDATRKIARPIDHKAMQIK